MGNIFDTDEHPGLKYMMEMRKKIAEEKWKNPEDQKQFVTSLENWRKNESKEAKDEFRKRYHFWSKNPEKLVLLSDIPMWSQVGWECPNYEKTLDFRPPHWYVEKKNDEPKKDDKEDKKEEPKIEVKPEVKIEEKKVENKKFLSNPVLYAPVVSDSINSMVSLYRGDICKLEIDAIQNAANNGMLGGGGIDGAIHNAAGDILVRECAALNGCKTGRTRITKGYDLPARYILHTVGPTDEVPEDLESCYVTTLKQAISHKIRSVALCCVSTGIFGYPREKAGHVAMSTVRKFLETYPKSFDRIIFVVFELKDEKMYNELMPLYFPCKDPKTPPQDPQGHYYNDDKQKWIKEYVENWTEAKKILIDKDPKEVEAWFAKKCGFGRRGWAMSEQTEEEKVEQAKKDHLCCEAFGLYNEEPNKLE